MLQIPDELFKIGNTGGHLVGEAFDGDNLHPGVDVAELVKNSHLGTDVIDHEGVFAKLHINTELSDRFSWLGLGALRETQLQHHRSDLLCAANNSPGGERSPLW